MRLTLQEFKTTHSWPAILNMDSSDPRWLQLLNLASHRLLDMGMWMGTTQRHALCVNSACITWPRNFQTIISMDVCGVPMVIRSQWHEFLENGPGLARVRCCGTLDSYDRGSGFAMFDDLTIPASKIRLYPQFSSDVGKTVTIRGVDSNYQHIITNGGNTDGEVMTLAMPYVDSARTYGKQQFRDVIKDKTKGFVRAYSYDATLPVPPPSPGPDDTPLKALAIWAPGETLPDYRRSFIPSMESGHGCCNGLMNNNSCQRRCVVVMAKIKFITIENDLDFLPIGNPSALGLAMLSVMREQRGDTAGAITAMNGTFDPIRKRYVNGAVPILEDELSAFQGAGVVDVIRTENGNIGGARTLNLI